MIIGADATATSFSFAGSPSPVNQDNILVESRLKEAKVIPSTGDFNRHRMRRRVAALPLFAIFLGSVLLLSICGRSFWKLAWPGPLSRRLAGLEDDDELDYSSDIERLCAAAQDWIPERGFFEEQRASPALVGTYLENLEQPSEEQRASPDVVEAYLKSLEQPPEEQPELPWQIQAAIQTLETVQLPFKRKEVTKRFTPEEPADESDNDEPGPSTKFMRTAAGRHSPPPSTTAPSSASLESSPISASSQLGAEVTGIFPVSGDAPSTSTATPPPSSAQALAGGGDVHPYIRRPIRRSKVPPREWMPRHVMGGAPLGNYMDSMAILRALLLQRELNDDEAIDLMKHTEVLANHAYQRLSVPWLAPAQLSKLTTRLAFKFLVFDQMYNAWQVVSDSPPPWWQAVADAALRDCDAPVSLPVPKRYTFYHPLALKLSAALDKYKNGSSPTPEEIMEIKLVLFRRRQRPPLFRRQEWEPWTQDGQGAL